MDAFADSDIGFAVCTWDTAEEYCQYADWERPCCPPRNIHFSALPLQSSRGFTLRGSTSR